MPHMPAEGEESHRLQLPGVCLIFGVLEMGLAGQMSRDILRLWHMVQCVAVNAELGGSTVLRGLV